MSKDKKDKKKFKDTKMGAFLAAKAPNIIDMVGDVFPPVKLLQTLIGGAGLNPADKAELDALMLDYEKEITARQISEDENVTERWKADAMSDSWLSKNARPLTLLSLMIFMFIIIITDSIDVLAFEVKAGYVSLLGQLLTAVVLAYFGGRSAEKVFKKKS